MNYTTMCYVCEYGWIIIGGERVVDNNVIEVSDASVVRSWRNGKGIGGIAKAENKDEYTLDPIGDVVISKDKILFRIPCEW